MDSDGDGVPDGIDRCDATARGASVDSDGCAMDSDNDGVMDGVDRCPNTPRGAKVEADGCPIDSDGDGVYDGIDRCPYTPAGREVDAEGCATNLTALEQEVVDTGKITARNITFATGTADLTSEARTALDEIGNLLSDYPMVKVEVGGHTDDRGSDALNQDLSEKRAQAVLAYLTSNFPKIERANLTSRGYGEGKPVASNASASGRAENRRVEFVFLNLDDLRN
jgi:OOP family OmpA-OmpF porin